MVRIKELGFLPWPPWKKRRSTRYEPPPSSPKDEETLLNGEESDEGEEEEGEEEVKGGYRRSVKPSLWVVLSVVATLGGRKMLRGGFGEFNFLEREAEMRCKITC
jgi:hypothetical protein